VLDYNISVETTTLVQKVIEEKAPKKGGVGESRSELCQDNSTKVTHGKD